MSRDLGCTRNRAREQAIKLLTHYIESVWRKAGIHWDSANAAEIRELVEAIIDAADNG